MKIGFEFIGKCLAHVAREARLGVAVSRGQREAGSVRTAEAKRRMEHELLDNGYSRKTAKRITAKFFAESVQGNTQ